MIIILWIHTSSVPRPFHLTVSCGVFQGVVDSKVSMKTGSSSKGKNTFRPHLKSAILQCLPFLRSVLLSSIRWVVFFDNIILCKKKRKVQNFKRLVSVTCCTLQLILHQFEIEHNIVYLLSILSPTQESTTILTGNEVWVSCFIYVYDLE